jgi:hypothetical protein
MKIESLAQYIAYIRSVPGSTILFRGQNADLPLIPKLGRLNLKDDLLSAEQGMLEDLKQLARPFLMYQSYTEWDILAVAQHHGMATRLLDWTTNPLTALWFAVEQPPMKLEQPDGKKTKKSIASYQDGVVWVFSPKNTDRADVSLSPYSLKITKFFRPSHSSNRIAAQSGWFSVHAYNANKKGFISVNNNKLYKDKLKKIIIPHESFATIRSELEQCNVNASTIYPDLDGLCRHITWKHSYLRDEYGEEDNLHYIVEIPNPKLVIKI